LPEEERPPGADPEPRRKRVRKKKPRQREGSLLQRLWWNRKTRLGILALGVAGALAWFFAPAWQKKQGLPPGLSVDHLTSGGRGSGTGGASLGNPLTERQPKLSKHQEIRNLNTKEMLRVLSSCASAQEIAALASQAEALRDSGQLARLGIDPNVASILFKCKDSFRESGLLSRFRHLFK
jgi:hypothetical protein